MSEHRDITVPNAGPRRIVTVAALLLGTLTAVLGIWALAAPESFADTIAPFAPYNAHYLRDLGAFQLGIGASLLVAAAGGDGLLVALGGYAIGGSAHVLSHLVDRDLGGHAADAPALGLLVVVAVGALALRARAFSSRVTPSWPRRWPPPLPDRVSIPVGGERDETTDCGRLAEAGSPSRPVGDAKPYAFAALWLALLVQVIWMVGSGLASQAIPDKAAYDGAIVVGFAALAATGGRVRWLGGGVRVLVALAFLGSVGDRFGLLGRAGDPGVSWGDYAHFVAYTGAVNAFLPAAWAPMLAGLATLAEASLGLALLLGVRPRFAAGGAATLLLLFGVAMTVSLGPAAALGYAVGVLAAGAWALATIDASAFGFDAFWSRRSRRSRRSRLAVGSQ